MAIDRKQGHKVIKGVRTEDATGIRMDIFATLRW